MVSDLHEGFAAEPVPDSVQSHPDKDAFGVFRHTEVIHFDQPTEDEDGLVLVVEPSTTVDGVVFESACVVVAD